MHISQLGTPASKTQTTPAQTHKHAACFLRARELVAAHSHKLPAARTAHIAVQMVSSNKLFKFLSFNFILGLTCDVQAGRCVGSEYHLLMAQIGASKLNKKEFEQITINLIPRIAQSSRPRPNLFSGFRLKKFCPNKDFSCDDTQTCCELTDGDYGCCPLGPDAICCEDHEHCCPHGTECDVAGGACTSKKN